MINLLPIEHQKELRAGLTNSLLVRYVVLAGGVLVILLAIIAFTYLFLQNIKGTAQNTIAENNLRAAEYADAETKAAEFRSNLATAKKILSNGTQYTQMLIDIAKLLPNGVVMDQLTLDASTFGTPTTLTMRASSYSNAIRLKDVFQASDIFTEVHFSSVSTREDDGPYPYMVQLTVTIKKPTGKAGL